MSHAVRTKLLWTSVLTGALVGALAPLAGCLDFNDCTEGEGEVVGRFLYAVDDSGTEADLHAVDVRGAVMYAVGDAGALVTGTPDDGTWTVRDAGTSADLVGVATLDGSIAVAVGSDGTIVRTDDAGESWEAIDGGFPAGSQLSAVATVGTEGFVIVGNGVGAWSDDEGETWNAAGGLDGTSLNGVALIKDTRMYAVGDAGAVAESPDGGATWEVDTIDDEFSELDLRGVSFRGGGEGRIIANSGRVLATDNSGLSWTSDGVVAGVGYGVELVTTETWVAAEGGAIFYRYHTDPAYVERVITVGAERFYDVRVNPYGDAVFVGEKGVIVRGRLEYTQIPQYCYGS